MLVITLSLALLASVLCNIKLYHRLRAYEHTWEQIEQVADRNEDGSFTINFEHYDEHPFDAHSPISQPNIQILDLDDLNTANDTPPRAA